MRMVKMKRRHQILSRIAGRIIEFGMFTIKSRHIIDFGINITFYIGRQYNVGSDWTIKDHKYIVEKA